MKTLLLGAGASKSYCQSPTKVKMPIAKDFFHTFNCLEINQNPWVRIGDIVNYLRDYYAINPSDFMNYNGDIEELHSEIEGRLKNAILENNHLDIIRFHRPYMQLIFLFCSVINEIQNGPVSKAHTNIANCLSQDDCVITFNWDTLMDRALYYVTEWRPETGYVITPRCIYKNRWENVTVSTRNSNAPKLIKLHGSTNWLTSYMLIEDGKFTLTQDAAYDTFYVYEFTNDPYDTYDGRFMDGYQPFSYGYYPVNLPEDGKKARDGHVFVKVMQRDPYTPKGEAGKSGLVSMPLIIPPVKDKAYTLFGEIFKHLWRSAEEALIKTDDIIIIGYSFPNTDFQTNILFKNAFMKRRDIPKHNNYRPLSRQYS